MAKFTAKFEFTVDVEIPDGPIKYDDLVEAAVIEGARYTVGHDDLVHTYTDHLEIEEE